MEPGSSDSVTSLSGADQKTACQRYLKLYWWDQ